MNKRSHNFQIQSPANRGSGQSRSGGQVHFRMNFGQKTNQQWIELYFNG